MFGSITVTLDYHRLIAKPEIGRCIFVAVISGTVLVGGGNSGKGEDFKIVQ
jgi:hypothetical protein